MVRIEEGQCGLCRHFGDGAANADRIVQVRIRGEAPDDLQVYCHHPQHEPLDLVVHADDGCRGFEPAAV